MDDGGGSELGDRTEQEDAWLAARTTRATLCAVCDGMGAATSGRPAAELTLSTLRAAFQRSPEPSAIVEAITAANRAVLARSRAAQRREPGSDIRWHGMGTTVEVALFVPGRAHLAHVGDGRIYRLRGDTLEQLTTDHTLLNERKRSRPEPTTEELAMIPPNVVVRALGMRDEVEIDQHDVEAAPGDLFLLCSDGLWAVVSDGDIAAILRRSVPVSAMVRGLLDAVRGARCNTGLGKDNATAVVHVVSAADGEW